MTNTVETINSILVTFICDELEILCKSENYSKIAYANKDILAVCSA